MTPKKRHVAKKTSVYSLKITAEVQRQIERLPGHIRSRIKDTISLLADNPRPAAAQPLRGDRSRYRIALGEWRIVYRVDEEVIVVEVLKVGKKHGPEFYTGID